MLTFVLKRSKAFIVLFLLLVIVGLYTFFTLPQREIPEITINIGTISTVYPGATVLDVERDITNPIERRLATIDGIEKITSSSAAGFSSIVITIEEKQDKNKVMADIRQAASDAATAFPSLAQQPNVTAISSSTPVLSYHITSDEREELTSLYSEMQRWKEEVEALPGVDRVIVKGVTDELVVISLDSERMAEARITLPQITQALKEEFNPIPLGKVEKDNLLTQLTLDHYRHITEIEHVFISLNTEGSPVYLKDIATVALEPKAQQDLISMQERPSISFTAYVQTGEDIPTVDERVSNKVSQLARNLPPEVELIPYYSQASLVKEIFEGLFLSLAIAVGAVILTAAIGLSFAGALSVALAVPLSVLIGLIPLPFAGVDLNQISIVGAIIALGILVDDSIVVNDNIQRHYNMGKNAIKGAVHGVKEVSVSIVTSTLAIVFTFLPLVFLSGSNGAFIRALPTVLITTILASTIIALFFVPMLRYSLHKRSNKNAKVKESSGFLEKPLNKLSNFYSDKVLKSTSKNPILVSALGLLLTTASFSLVVFTPFEFFPAADREEVTIDVTLPIGTTLQDTYETLEEMATFLSTDAGVFETSIFAGTGLPNLFNSSLEISGEYTGQIVVRVDREKQTAQGFITDWTNKLRKEYPDATIFLETITQGPPTGAPITVTVTGPELERLITLRNSLQQQMDLVGAGLVLDNIGKPEPTMKYVPIREKLEEYEVTINQVSEQIRMKTDGLPFGSFSDGMRKIDAVMYVDRLAAGDNLDLTNLEMVIANDGPPILVPLDELVTAQSSKELQRIPHLNGQRSIILRAYPGEVSDFKNKVTQIVEAERQSLDDLNYSIVIGGENEAQDSFFAEIIILFTIVIFLVYLLIAFQFNSLTLPFLVLIAVYLAIAGAIIGLFVTQTPISFLAVMGMVSLTGIVVRNSVVLIDFIEQGQKNGMTIQQAVMEAGRNRLRPIILTAITSIVALVPIASMGDPLFQPLAVTIISGILFSTVLTLIIVPMLYLVFARFRKANKVIDSSKSI